MGRVKLIIVRQPAKGTEWRRKEKDNPKEEGQLKRRLNELFLQIEEIQRKGRKFSKCLTYV
ncbi:MAG: hypothetical protein KDE33_00505 [Bacteroidetes bacterium]|nr:hypothetical protein [Bacteroidota bacterium]